VIATGTLKRARRRRLDQVLTLCATIVLGAGIALVWVRVVQTLTESAKGPPTVGQPGALVWNGRVFTSSAQFKAYLTSKGFSYSRWAARHPTAFGGSAPTATTRKTKATVKTTTTKPAKSKPKPATHHVAAPTANVTSSRPLAATVLMFLLLIVGLVVGGSVLMPPRYAPVAVQRFYANPDRRMLALAAAAATLLGLGVSFFVA
jgi:hypothetical protein